MGAPSWTDIVAAVVVIYGAVLSTYNLVRDMTKDKPKGKTECGLANLAGPGADFDPLISVSFSNTGRIRVKIEECGLVLESKRKLMFPSNEFRRLPAVVDPQESFSLWASIDDINSTLTRLGFQNGDKVRGYCRDALGRYYYSKKMKYGLLNK